MISILIIECTEVHLHPHLIFIGTQTNIGGTGHQTIHLIMDLTIEILLDFTVGIIIAGTITIISIMHIRGIIGDGIIEWIITTGKIEAEETLLI